MKKLKLSQGKFALVDDADFEWLNQWKWSYNNVNGCEYANRCVNVSKGKTTNLTIHRVIMGTVGTKKIIDHIDGNGLNNQKNNLRICTHSENMKNRRFFSKTVNKDIKYKGLVRMAGSKRFYVMIKSKGKSYSCRGYVTQEEAALKYNEMALKLHGKYARLNKIIK